MDCERLFYFSHEESGQELLHLDTILALKVLETMGIVVTMEGIEEVDLVMMIMDIVVTVEGLQGTHHHIEVVEIIHRGTHPHLMVEDLGGTGPGHFLILHMVAQIGGMLVDLGDVF